MMNWFAVYVKQRHEKNVSKIFAFKGIESLLPLYLAKQKWSDRVKEIELPLFPGYVFTKFNPSQRVQILRTPGVFDIVRFGSDLAPVDPQEIGALQLLMRSGLVAEPWPQLEIGDQVEIDHGPLAGCKGVFVESKKGLRLQLSVTLLSRAVSVEVEREWVRRIPPPKMHAPFAPMHRRHELPTGIHRYTA